MNPTIRSANKISWIQRIWKALVAWENAASEKPLEILEQRVSNLEQKVSGIGEGATRKTVEVE